MQEHALELPRELRGNSEHHVHTRRQARMKRSGRPLCRRETYVCLTPRIYVLIVQKRNLYLLLASQVPVPMSIGNMFEKIPESKHITCNFN